MTKSRGNSSRYQATQAGALESLWGKRVKVDPFQSNYDRAKKARIADEPLKGSDLVKALDFIAEITGDEAFRSAVLAMRAYSLDRGGLKQNALQMMKEQRQTAEWAAMPLMHSLVLSGLESVPAAKEAAAQLGIPGQSFSRVVDRLRKTYPAWKQSLAGQLPAPRWLDGDTGRTLRVRLARPWLGADNQPISELMGVQFGDDGFGIAADNREWRRLIYEGHIALYGVIEPAGKNMETNNQATK